MSRDESVYLDDILEATARIGRYVEGIDFNAFAADEKTVDAVIRNLEIIGEAAGRISDSTRRKSPEIEWPKITGLRNLLIHEYFGVNHKIIWDVVQTKLTPLSDAIKRIQGN